MESSNQEKLITDLLTVNMGPQHPATHGVLRVEIKTDSEIVAEATEEVVTPEAIEEATETTEEAPVEAVEVVKEEKTEEAK